MRSSVPDKTTSDPSMKDASIKDAEKKAKEKSAKRKATNVISCRKSGNSVLNVFKQRCINTGDTLELEPLKDKKGLGSAPNQVTMQASGNNTENCPPLYSSTSSSHSKSPVMPSHTQYTPNIVPVNLQLPCKAQKFQLQLFPIDEFTRKSLEEENLYPYLELTITTKKKIASVIKHLNFKWGNSRHASEELVLFPYNARAESLEGCKRWSLKDSCITAAEIHASIGKPAVFKLRYGWFKHLEPKLKSSQTYHIQANQINSIKTQKKELADEQKQLSSGVSPECKPFHFELVPKQSVQETSKSIQPVVNLISENDGKFSWVDGVSNMSFGALFSAVEADEGSKVCCQLSHHSIPVTCDSFDAAIAAHVSRYQPLNQPSAMVQPSILDAEETRNPFLFHSLTSNKNVQVQSVNSSSQTMEPQRLSPLLEDAKNDDFVPLNTILPSKDGSLLIGDEDAQLSVDSKVYKHSEKEATQIDMNTTNTVNNQFEGFDMHWPTSIESWHFEVSFSIDD